MMILREWVFLNLTLVEVLLTLTAIIWVFVKWLILHFNQDFKIRNYCNHMCIFLPALSVTLIFILPLLFTLKICCLRKKNQMMKFHCLQIFKNILHRFCVLFQQKISNLIRCNLRVSIIMNAIYAHFLIAVNNLQIVITTQIVSSRRNVFGISWISIC